MKTTHKYLIGCLSVIVILVIGSIFVIKSIESTIFKGLASGEYGITFTAQSRSGSMFSGYKFRSATLHQPKGQVSESDVTINFPRLSFHYKYFPLRFTEISWDESTLILNSDSGEAETIPIGPGEMIRDSSGWLDSGEVRIGEEAWDGVATFRIRGDGEHVDNTVTINRLPGKFIEFASDSTNNFALPRFLVLEMTIEGASQNPNIEGTLTNPNTRQVFRF